MVRDQTIDNLPARVREERRRDDIAHLRPAESKLRADRFVGDGKIVAAHVVRRVQQAEKSPIQPASRAKAGRILHARGRRRSGFNRHAASLNLCQRSNRIFARQLNKPRKKGQKDSCETRRAGHNLDRTTDAERPLRGRH